MDKYNAKVTFEDQGSEILIIVNGIVISWVKKFDLSISATHEISQIIKGDK